MTVLVLVLCCKKKRDGLIRPDHMRWSFDKCFAFSQVRIKHGLCQSQQIGNNSANTTTYERDVVYNPSDTPVKQFNSRKRLTEKSGKITSC